MSALGLPCQVVNFLSCSSNKAEITKAFLIEKKFTIILVKIMYTNLTNNEQEVLNLYKKKNPIPKNIYIFYFSPINVNKYLLPLLS